MAYDRANLTGLATGKVTALDSQIFLDRHPTL
jgi:hypothetical protein